MAEALQETDFVQTKGEKIAAALDAVNAAEMDAIVGKMQDMNFLQKKDALIAPTEDELDCLCDLLLSQLKENCNEAFYTVGQGQNGEMPGLNDADLATSIATLEQMATKIGAKTIHLRDKTESDGKISEFLVRLAPDSSDFIDIRVAVVGNVDAGKSTLLGVLTHGELDNGRGKSRLKLFRHEHEADSGRTSSVAQNILGFGVGGEIVNKQAHDGTLDWIQICNDAAKVLAFIDLAGHEKYLKTTVFGLTGHMPSFVMLMIGANAGVIGMTKEHLGLALALNKPVFVVVTKIDMCPPNVLASTLKLLQKILKSPGCRKMPILVNNTDDVVDASKNFLSQRLCPIFQVSNVTGQNLDLLRKFLNLMRPTIPTNPDVPGEFNIDDTFSVPGVGTVVSGTTVCGTIRNGQTMLLGPDSTGEFIPVGIKGVHRRRVTTNQVCGGQTASFALKKIKRSAIRKGMVLIDPAVPPRATWEFDAEILILHHPSTITCKYQAMVHVGSVRQTAALLKMHDKEFLRTGDRSVCRLRFIRYPEFIREGTRIVFREGRTKAVGTITKLIPTEDELAPGATYKDISKRVRAQQQDMTTAQRLLHAQQDVPDTLKSIQQQA
eukprot:m.30335 g.30335  ORF g.30335 m.30335 type:complete len:607 (+) comp16265_c0_seq1:235-2055(+)